MASGKETIVKRAQRGIDLAVDADKTGKTTIRKKSRPGKSERAPDYGNALRSIYDEAMHEEIPSEMLDLLGKLR